MTPLSDNSADERYLYQVTVFTGMRGSAGTRSRVSLVVSGDRDDTGVRRLTDGTKTVRRNGWGGLGTPEGRAFWCGMRFLAILADVGRRIRGKTGIDGWTLVKSRRIVYFHKFAGMLCCHSSHDPTSDRCSADFDPCSEVMVYSNQT